MKTQVFVGLDVSKQRLAVALRPLGRHVPLDWEAYIAALRPQGRLRLVGAVTQPLAVPLFPLLLGQKSLSASPTGSPAAIAIMLDFAARHHIQPTIEAYRFSEINDALEKLRHGKPRYRIVLQP